MWGGRGLRWQRPISFHNYIQLYNIVKICYLNVFQHKYFRVGVTRPVVSCYLNKNTVRAESKN